ncbi:hypothetical protein NQ314_006879 [Rhamnusium bicolor]|uniref:Reverse transcriptase zinc-binding domain-containing protein n=1 Tax=Rhamnusium bicolor TaxID=1586634 RepID=A0AAV8YXC5_9CUCU|nr:hypothetical protein NQ314_006879 [Rhamnusium bicolor]
MTGREKSRDTGGRNYHVLPDTLAGHGSFRTYTKRIGKQEQENCVYCGETDTVEHTIFMCDRWERIRQGAWNGLGVNITADEIGEQIVANEEKWRIITNMIRKIMSQKETEERLLQRIPNP